MKANGLSCKDLMVGDWVLVRPFPDSEPVKSKITAINYNSYRGKDYTDWVDTDFWDELSLDQVEPIPLTPEILEKNRFIKGSKAYYGEALRDCVLADGLWIDILGKNYFEGKLEYVHQLQHALRLCETEKEIEL